ncbi:methanethiol S-methyltransferase [Phenylobacterium montanum]|uniref:methanethiol S-methyltransferase n=1 Tax=Phenylobacterium montanum TaxID=2823693 RepID=A0A975G3U8_9CAUL|nr:methanethiol S-methyltransferase [Caulobacter sp. S6]QUD90171.1 isoprenylcysteine carboxylmethyltransferase family protein [Caulobacter sp. S6]
MRSLLLALYSACVYVFFLAVFVYAIAFVEGVGVPKTIDSGPASGLLAALAVDAALLSLFALQHTVMARPTFKRAWTKVIPAEAERSTFVLCASLALGLLVWQWRPMPALVWSVEAPVWSAMLLAVSWAGWALLLASTFLISHFQLFGLSQGFARMLKQTPEEMAFVTPLFYRWIRHPLYLGFILAFWAAPRMSLGHLVFAIATTGYILVGIWFEERDLVAHFGQRYLVYRQSVGMLFPRLRAPGAPRGLDAPRAR